MFGAFALIYGHNEGITSARQSDRWIRLVRLETCTAVGVLLVLIGLAGSVLAFSAWGARGFGAQDLGEALRVVLPSSTCIGVGLTVIFAGLFSSLLSLRRVNSPVVSTADELASTNV